MVNTKLLFSSFRHTRFEWVKRKKIVSEIIANGISALMSFCLVSIMKSFFAVSLAGDLAHRFGIKKDPLSGKKIIYSDTVEWISGILMFLIGLLLFTYLRKVIENYHNVRHIISESQSKTPSATK